MVAPVLQKAVREVLKSLSPGSTMVAADLGCSSGPNTLLVISEVMSTIGAYVQETADDSRAMEVQFFLNDLPGNDFNLVFRSLEPQLRSSLFAAEEEKAVPAPCYITGLPGSMYTRIFPCQSVHLFDSSHCLIWRSKGRIEKKKLRSFNMPYYAPSLDEVTQLIKHNDLFDLEDIKLFESIWDAHDDSDGDVVIDCSSSAESIAKIIRAGIEPLIVNHFGKDILDELFMVYVSILAKDLEKGKAMCPVIVVMLKKSKH
nr:unnamed protein product [Digitaria exilis]